VPIRLRTVKQTAVEYEAKDPDTVVNQYMLRRLIANGEIPIVRAGKKMLINQDVLEEYFAIGHRMTEAKFEHGIRPVGTNQPKPKF